MFFVQIVDGKSLQVKAIDQWTRELPIVAKRGEIVDCNGKTIVSSQGKYSVYARLRSVDNKEETAKILSSILNLNYDNLLKKLNSSVSEITVKIDCEKQEVLKLKEYNLNGVYYSISNSRVYPYGNLLCQVLGYTTNDGSGQSGLEKYYDKYLKGVNGEILYESDLVGVDIKGKNTHYLPSIDGLNLKLSVDLDIQTICDSVISDACVKYSPKSASAIVMDCTNGEILALSIKPDFDLNNIPRNDINLLNSLSRNTLFVDSYEPGSTFKIFTSAINIEEYLKGNKKAFSNTHIFNSNRYRYIGGTKIKCWSNHANGKHSNQNLASALNNSCNPIFVDIALSIGKNTYYNYLNKFNFGKSTGVDFNGEAIGMVVPESVVTENDLARIGFGQTIAVTPIQLLAGVNSAINGGKYFVPHLVKEIYDNSGKLTQKYDNKQISQPISQKTSQILASYLQDVVTNGSGKNAFIQGYNVGGKTGVFPI